MATNTYGKLFLIPNFLSAQNEDDFIAGQVRRMVTHIRNFVVEQEKPGRALLKRLQIQHPQADLKLWVLNEHTAEKDFSLLLKSLENEDAGLISDAGLPCIADPGSQLVALAQAKNIEVIPLPGASSILLTLMGSGFSGQKFSFQGYLYVILCIFLRIGVKFKSTYGGGINQTTLPFFSKGIFLGK